MLRIHGRHGPARAGVQMDSMCERVAQQQHQSCPTAFVVCLVNSGKGTGLRLEGRVRGGGGIPLLQNPALITACLLHGFHPCGWHRLQTRAMDEASKIKCRFIPTLVNEKPC